MMKYGSSLEEDSLLNLMCFKEPLKKLRMVHKPMYRTSPSQENASVLQVLGTFSCALIHMKLQYQQE